MLQLQAGVRLHGNGQRVVHVVEILDEAYARWPYRKSKTNPRLLGERVIFRSENPIGACRKTRRGAYYSGSGYQNGNPEILHGGAKPMRHVAFIAALAIISLAGSPSAFAQATTAQITGVISDSSRRRRARRSRTRH